MYYAKLPKQIAFFKKFSQTQTAALDRYDKRQQKVRSLRTKIPTFPILYYFRNRHLTTQLLHIL